MRSVPFGSPINERRGDLGPRGLEGDGWADVVIGQNAFTEITPFTVVDHKLFNPAGLAVDARPITTRGRLYVWDSGNSRVLGIDVAKCYGDGPCRAEVVLGQPTGGLTSACNGDSGFSGFPVRAPAGADTLCGVPEDAISVLEHKSAVGLAVSTRGVVYVPDFYNHRVLAFDDPFANDSVADAVWGQDGYTANACNRGAGAGASTLCFAGRFADGAGAAVDVAGNLWVADGGNNRVLRFPADPTGRPRTVADLVIGQRSFGAIEAGPGLDALSSPASVRIGRDGRLWVADRGNDRVVVFAPPFLSGMTGSTFGRGFADPMHVEPDPLGASVWVFDAGNGMYERWNASGSAVEMVAGKPAYQPDGTCLGPLCPGAGSFAFDAAGDLLVSAYGHVQDVIRFERQDLTEGALVETGRLFSEPAGYNDTLAARTSELGPIGGMAVGADQLIVGEGKRLLYWNGLEGLRTNQEASGIIDSAAMGFPEAWQGRMSVDDSSRVWSIRAEGIAVFALPLVADSRSTAVVLPPGEPVPVLGGGQLVPGRRLHGLAVGAGARTLWVAEPNAHRVFRVRDPLTAPLVDVILGQPGSAPGVCNRGVVPAPKDSGVEVDITDVLCFPGSVALDPQGNVFVGDHTIEAEGNWRQLVFLQSTVPEGTSRLITAPAADKVFPYRVLQPGATFEPAIDGFGRMIVGFNAYVVGREMSSGRRLGVYFNPLGTGVEPDGHFRDIVSLPWSVKTDSNDNVYVADSNRHRVLIYWRPFAPSVRPRLAHDVHLPLVMERR